MIINHYNVCTLLKAALKDCLKRAIDTNTTINLKFNHVLFIITPKTNIFDFERRYERCSSLKEWTIKDEKVFEYIGEHLVLCDEANIGKHVKHCYIKRHKLTY